LFLGKKNFVPGKKIVSLKKTLKKKIVCGTHRGRFQFIVILTPWGVSFHPVVVIGLGKSLLFKSVLAHRARFLRFFPPFLPIFFFVATFSCEWWLWETDDVTTMIIHYYILYCNLRDLHSMLKKWLEPVPISKHTYEEFIIVNKWMMMTYWRKILWRSEDTNPVKKYSCCALLRVHADSVFFPVKFCSGLALATN